MDCAAAANGTGRRVLFVRCALGVAVAASALLVAPAAAQPRAVASPIAAEPKANPHNFATVFSQRHTFAAVGDSMTAGDSDDIDHGDAGSRSWARYASSKDLRFIGGWALGGTTTATMAAHVEPYSADVLVVMAGTNDFLQGVPFSESARNIETIVHEAKVSKVLVARLAPNDADPGASLSFSTQLQDLAAEHGWTYVDAMREIRTRDNRYRAGLTEDGTHPVPEAARLMGVALRAAIEDAAE